jgi:hypothetical protein
VRLAHLTGKVKILLEWHESAECGRGLTQEWY